MADNTIEDIKRLRRMHSKPWRKTSDASNSNHPTDNTRHLPKACIYARIKHYTSLAHRMRAGKPGTRHGISAVYLKKGKI